MKYPTFLQTLQALDITDVERAKRLEVSTKTIERYRAGDFPEPLLKLMRHPSLLRALAEDAERLVRSDNLVDIAA